MNHESTMSQQQGQATAAKAAAETAEDDSDDSVYPQLQRHDRVRFWKMTINDDNNNNDDEGTLGVVLELIDNDYIKISSDEANEVCTIHRACIKLVMPAALWIKEAFRRWCQSEVISASYTTFSLSDFFQFQEVFYDDISLDDEMAYELENALHHNETYTSVVIAVDSPMLFHQVHIEQLNSLVMALLSLPNLQRLFLHNIRDGDVVDAVFANLGVAGRLTDLEIFQSLLPNIQFSYDLWNAGEQKPILTLYQPMITSLERSRDFIAQVAAQNWFGCVCLNVCSAHFVCLFLQEMTKSNSNVNHLEIWNTPDAATEVVSNESTGTMGLFLETLRSCLISRAEHKLQPLHLAMRNNNVNYHHFVDTLLLHDNVCHLDLCCETVDDKVTNAIGHLLKRTKKLRTLKLPRWQDDWTCSEERQLEIINSIAMNQSLHELFTGCSTLKTLFWALCNNQSLEKLTVTVGEAGPDDLEALKHFTTLRELEIDGSSFDVASVAAALRKNTSLEHVKISCYHAGRENYCSKDICTNDNQVCTYLAQNRWFHRNEALFLKKPGSISAALWSHVLARLSSNPTFLFKLIQANPDIFLECRPIQK